MHPQDARYSFLMARVIIVGAGFGGLACAVALAEAGVEVEVMERAEVPGGKAHLTQVGGRAVDAGPTVLTMRWVFEGYEHLFEPLDVLARHAFADGTMLDLFADRMRSADAIGRFAGVKESQRYLAFARQAEEIWALARGPFVLSQRPSWSDIVKHTAVHGLRAMMKIDAHRTMARALEGAFEDPRLRQLFGRYATYCGGSPYETPATYNLVAHVESEGVDRVRGGVAALARAMADRAVAAGARFRYGTDVRGIVVERGRATGVRVGAGDGEDFVGADAVVMNGDVAHLPALGARGAAPVMPPAERSLSAFTLAMAGRTRGFDLASHTVFFSVDYEEEWRELARRVPSDPTVYVYTPDHESFLLVVNAPATGDEPERWMESEIDRCHAATMSTLARAGLSFEPSAFARTTPVDFARRYPATGGALYGARPRGMTSALARAGSRSEIRRLYLAGGSVHPGPGVPMATLSGRLAAESVIQDLASTVRSRTAATSGTTSTA